MRVLAIAQRNTFRRLMERALPDASFVWSERKLEALSKVVTEPPDLILIALEDTFESESLAIALADQPLPRVLLSPFQMNWWYRFRIRRTGALYLAMPIAPEELGQKIKRLLARKGDFRPSSPAD